MAATSRPTILLTAASGNIGKELVPLLAREEVSLVLPTSNATRLKDLHSKSLSVSQHVVVEEGSVKDSNWVQSLVVKHNVDTVFVCFSSATDESIATLHFLDALHKAGTVKHVVFLSSALDHLSDRGIKDLYQDTTSFIALAKAAVEQKLAYGNYSWTLTRIGPTLFFENDILLKNDLLQNSFFPEPYTASTKVSRVAASDIALAVRNALLNPGRWAGTKVLLGTRRTYTAEDTAEIWSNGLGRSISVQDDFDSYERNLIKELQGGGFDLEGAKTFAGDLRLMWEEFEHRPYEISDEEYRV